MTGPSLTYQSVGVDLKRGESEGNAAVALARSTFGAGVIEYFNNLFAQEIDLKAYTKPVLVATTDGTGTKPKYCVATGRHDTIGIDLVAMNVNDLVRNNVKPLFLLDYLASGEDIAHEIKTQIVKGISDGCIMAGCSLLGGETATMPGVYATGEYDLAAFAVGIADKDKIITGQAICEGDLCFGLPSSGPHDNGYTLIRTVYPPEQIAGNAALISEILTPTRIYVNPVLAVNERFDIHGWAHITGGGIPGKLGDIIPNGLQAEIVFGSWPVPEIFRKIQQAGPVEDQEMRSIFNMGLGMIGVGPESAVFEVIRFLKDQGEDAHIVGKIKRIEKVVIH